MNQAATDTTLLFYISNGRVYASVAARISIRSVIPQPFMPMASLQVTTPEEVQNEVDKTDVSVWSSFNWPLLYFVRSCESDICANHYLTGPVCPYSVIRISPTHPKHLKKFYTRLLSWLRISPALVHNPVEAYKLRSLQNNNFTFPMSFRQKL